MKVEIGESLVYSWLRHVKHCEIVQLNWKTSPIWTGSKSVEYLQDLMNKSSKFVGEPFKGTVKVKQLLKQAEIDSIGINLTKNKVYAVDIAFHENGLNYGSADKTANNIAKKILRTLFILKQHFNKIEEHKILFISPKIRPSYSTPIQAKLEKIREFIEYENLSCSIEVISNEDFNSNIIEPITSLSKNVADTSELFLRSIQLLDMYVEKTSKKTTPFPKVSNTDITLEIKKVHRKVPIWFTKESQANSKILLKYMELRGYNKKITTSLLERECVDVENFHNSYNQMKNISERNNAKVFQEKNGSIVLWEKVEEFIISEYNQYIKNRLTSCSN